MYEFNYQYLQPEKEPYFTCIVPTDWLSKRLPIMGGCVNYANKRDQLISCGPTVFEFSEEVSSDESSRTILVDIISDGMKWLDKSAAIHCSNLTNMEGVDVEVVLLNHFFGFNALSFVGNVYLDFSDVRTVMRMSSNFDFKFGVGETPSDILPNILDRDAMCAFSMIFCNDKMMKIAILDEVVGAMQDFYSENAVLIFSDVSVGQDQMLISSLIGR